MASCNHPGCQKKIRKLLNDRRTAFMMAWHPRLGAYSLIRTYVAKDVAKIIAKRYITAHGQVYNTLIKKGFQLLDRNANTEILCIESQTQSRSSAPTLIQMSYIDHCMGISSQVSLQTPVMKIPWNPRCDIGGDPGGENKPRHLSLAVDDPVKCAWFEDWMNEIDVRIQSAMGTQDELHTFKKHESGAYPPVFNVRIPDKKWDKIMVYNPDRTVYGTFQQAYTSGKICRGTLIKAIVTHVGVWKVPRHGLYNQWELTQVLIIRDVLPTDLNAFAFNLNAFADDE